jgi:hypothetical protein
MLAACLKEVKHAIIFVIFVSVFSKQQLGLSGGGGGGWGFGF